MQAVGAAGTPHSLFLPPYSGRLPSPSLRVFSPPWLPFVLPTLGVDLRRTPRTVWLRSWGRVWERQCRVVINPPAGGQPARGKAPSKQALATRAIKLPPPRVAPAAVQAARIPGPPSTHMARAARRAGRDSGEGLGDPTLTYPGKRVTDPPLSLVQVAPDAVRGAAVIIKELEPCPSARTSRRRSAAIAPTGSASGTPPRAAVTSSSAVAPRAVSGSSFLPRRSKRVRV